MTWQRSLTISGIRMKNTTENIMRLYFGVDIIYVYSGGTIRREDMGIFVYNVADSKYEEVDVRRCKWHV